MAKFISIDEITPGMTIVEPIINKFGQVIIAAGIEIKPRHIGRLKTWGITHISIKTHDSPGYSEQLLELARERIEKRVLWTPRNPEEKDIYHAAIELTAQNIINGSRSMS